MTIASQWNTQFNARGWILAVRNNVLTFEWDDSFSQFSTTGAWTPVADTWYHVKVVKCQGTIRLFVDGVQVGSTYLCSISDRQISNGSTSTNIGCHFVLNVATDLFNGWIDEFRIIRQSETTSANGRFYDPYFYPIGTFTPPVDEYDFNRTVMSLRSLPGLCRLGGLADWSNDGGASHTYTSTFAFFDNEFSRMVGLGGLKWDPSTWYQKKYGSVPHPVLDYYTNGSSWVQGSPLTADNRQLRTKAFTFDTFVNFTTDPNSISQALFGHYDDSGNQRSFLLYYDSALNDVKFTWYDGTTALGTATFAWADPAINTWYHIAFVRDGDALRFYVDGVLQTAGGDTLPANYSFFQSSANWGIGVADTNFAGGNPFWHLRGAMQDPRVTWKALYNAGFTPPANPPLTIGSCIE
jgi:hypothetical protein